MVLKSLQYPLFKWENKGYGTKDHLLAIKLYGITEFHRKSFRDELFKRIQIMLRSGKKLKIRNSKFI